MTTDDDGDDAHDGEYLGLMPCRVLWSNILLCVTIAAATEATQPQPDIALECLHVQNMSARGA
eukprot:3173467-Karenia_brevis.AAC.1